MAEWATIGAGLGSTGIGVATARWMLAHPRVQSLPESARRSSSWLHPAGLAAVGAALALAAGWLLASPTVGVVGPLLAVIGWVEHRRRVHQTRHDRLLDQLPVLVDTMIQQLRSGASLHNVCSDPPAPGVESERVLRPMVDALRRRRPLVEAVTKLVDDEGHPAAVELLATALSVLAHRGGPAVPALQRLRLTLMGFVHAQAESRAQAAQAMASAGLLAVAPGLFAVLIATLDADAARFYLRELPGTACVVFSLVATYLGWRWMDRAIAAAVSVGSGRRRAASPAGGRR